MKCMVRILLIVIVLHLQIINRKNSQVKLKKNSIPFNGTAQRAKNVGIVIMCSECECWQLFYPKQKFNEQEKKLLIAYLDTIDYSCGSSFYNAENLFGFQKEQSINNKSDNNTEIESDTELVVTRSELKNKKHVSNEIELSNIENNSDYDNSLLNQNEADNLQSDSEIWENLFYRSNDVNSELADNNESDDYDSYELANSNESEEDLNGSVDSEESDDSEAKSLTDFELLDADKPTIKQIFEKLLNIHCVKNAHKKVSKHQLVENL